MMVLQNVFRCLERFSGLAPVDEESKRLNSRIKKILDDKNWQSNIGKSLEFKSEFPYGFSSSKDYDDFKTYKVSVYKGSHRQFEVELEKVFPNYVARLANNRYDFSPKNDTIVIGEERMKEPKNNKIELKKETSSKLLSLAVYTDFQGFSNNPNGLMQFEFSRLIPLYTKRRPNSFMQRYIDRAYNAGRFNYITPQFRWSRLDSADDTENLALSYHSVFEGGTEKRLPFVTTLDMLRYENISVGADLNLILMDFPTSKYRFELNLGGRFGRTKVLDTKGEPIAVVNDSTSIIPSFDVNTWRVYPEFLLRLRPDERLGANLSFRPIRFNTVTTDFSTVSSEEEFRNNLNDNPQWLNQIEINGFWSPSGRKENRFFFRYRYTNNSNWETNGFSEWQLGYSLTFRVQNKKDN